MRDAIFSDVTDSPAPLPSPAPVARPKTLTHAAWLKARQVLLEAAERPGELVALLGVAGVGKTLLLAELERHWSAMGRRVELVENGDLATGREATDILLIDEAGRLSPEVLRQVAADRDRTIVLAALPGFAARLSQIDFHPVALTELEPGEIAAYVAARLEAMGHPPARVGSEAMAAMGAVSGGVPRLLNLLLGSAVFAAGLEGVATVTREHVREAAEMHHLPAAALLREPLVTARADAAPVSNPQPVDRPPDPDMANDSNGLAVSSPQAPSQPARPMAPAPHPGGVASTRRRLWGGLALVAVILAGIGVARVARQPPAPPTAAIEAEAPATARAPGISGETTEPSLTEPVAVPRVEPEPGVASPPVEPPARIVIIHPAGDAASSARARRLNDVFRRAGLWAATPFAVPRTEEGDVLRYFFEEDRNTALSVAALAGNAGMVPRLAGLPAGAAMPRPGTVEWALARGATMQPLRTTAPDVGLARGAQPAPPPVSTPQEPAHGSVIDVAQWPAEIILRWNLPAGEAVFVEVQALDGVAAGEPGWREVFSGYATEPLQQGIQLSRPGSYAWRLFGTSPGVPRYTAGAWSRFTLRGSP